MMVRRAALGAAEMSGNLGFWPEDDAYSVQDWEVLARETIRDPTKVSKNQPLKFKFKLLTCPPPHTHTHTFSLILSDSSRKVQLIPEPLFYYRTTASSMAQTASTSTISRHSDQLYLRSFLRDLPLGLGPLVPYLADLKLQVEEIKVST